METWKETAYAVHSRYPTIYFLQRTKKRRPIARLSFVLWCTEQNKDKSNSIKFHVTDIVDEEIVDYTFKMYLLGYDRFTV